MAALMTDHYDALETRDPALREREQCARLPEIVKRAMSAPGWAKHLAGVDPKSVTSRAALTRLPVLRKSDIAVLQKDNPPFGGLNVTAPGKARRLLMSPGPIFEPEAYENLWCHVRREKMSHSTVRQLNRSLQCLSGSVARLSQVQGNSDSLANHLGRVNPLP